jgi:hypothetical protein
MLIAGSVVALAAEPPECPRCFPPASSAASQSPKPVKDSSGWASDQGKATGGEEESDAFLPCCPFPVPVGIERAAAPKLSREMLANTITRLVRPHCWKSAGGECDLNWSADGESIIVNAPADVQKEVMDVLQSLRMNRGASIEMEVRAVTISDSKFTQSGLSRAFGFAHDQGSPAQANDQQTEASHHHQDHRVSSVLLKDWQLALVMDSAQSDPLINVMQAPKMVFENGQTVNCDFRDVLKVVTGMKIEQVDGMTRGVPESQTVGVGVGIHVCGVLASDRNSVTFRLNASNTFATCENNKVSFLRTDFGCKSESKLPEGGRSTWDTASSPRYQTISTDACSTIPCDSTLMIYGGAVETVEEIDCSIPVLGGLPFLKSVFAAKETVRRVEHQIWMVTPRVATPSDGETGNVDTTRSVGISNAAVAMPDRDSDCPRRQSCPTSPSANGAEKAGCCAKCPTCPACQMGNCCEQVGGCPNCPACHSGKCCPNGACPSCRSSAGEEEWCMPANDSTHSIRSAKSPVELRAEKKAVELVAMYREACRNGESEKARLIAREALDLDPECFAKPAECAKSPANLTANNPCPTPGAESDKPSNWILPVGLNAPRNRLGDDFWSHQTKDDITRELMAPYTQMPFTPVPPAAGRLAPAGR